MHFYVITLKVNSIEIDTTIFILYVFKMNILIISNYKADSHCFNLNIIVINNKTL